MGSLSGFDEVQKLQVLKSKWLLTVTGTLVAGNVTSIWRFHSLQPYHNTVIFGSQLVQEIVLAALQSLVLPKGCLMSPKGCRPVEVIPD
jgi:hypothetical protein